MAVDPALKPYEKVSGVSGNLNSIGSDTLNNLMTLWAEGFRAIYPNVNVQIEGKGSSTAPPALIEGTAQLGPMSREMKAAEIDAFEKKYGYKPTAIKVAIDSLAVFAHKDNLIKASRWTSLTASFRVPTSAACKPINTWGELGLTGEWANRPISLYGRNSASGTYGFFKEHVMKNGDFRSTVKEQPVPRPWCRGLRMTWGRLGTRALAIKRQGERPATGRSYWEGYARACLRMFQWSVSAGTVLVRM